MIGPLRIIALVGATALAFAGAAGVARASDAELQRVIQLAEKGDVAGLNAMRPGLDATEAKIADWLSIRFGNPDLSSQFITRFALANPGWPDPESIRRRAEQALERENPGAAIVIRAFEGSRAYSSRGRMLLTRAYLSVGRAPEAQREIRLAFRDPKLSREDEDALLGEFSSLLTPADFKARLDTYLLRGRGEDASRIAKKMGPAYQQLAQARLAVEKGAKNAGALIDGLPSAVKSEPSWLFGKAQWARRNERWQEAAELLARAPKDPAVMALPDEWWEEKRIVARKMLDMGNPQLAYKIVATHTGSSPAEQADADFYSGWLALRQLNDARSASKHFARVIEDSVKPVTQARGYYWLGRAAEAGGSGNAREYYNHAAQFGFTFYGQMARAKLGASDLGLDRTVTIGSGDKAAMERDDRYDALVRLERIGRKDLAGILYRHMADTLETPGKIAILIGHAERQGMANVAVSVGKTAAQRNMDMQVLAFPVSGMPADLDTSGLEKALAFAITRQESEFNQSVVSSAGATGIFQVMPDTGKDAAKMLGITFNKAAWKSDPQYNIRLGAAYVNRLVTNYDGNYVMAIAGYNAGPGRIRDWVQVYGDPRDPSVDIIDWMERIPFSETRNYVHRVMENLQVYRFRLDGKRLMIADDLKRGVGARGALLTGSVPRQAANN